MTQYTDINNRLSAEHQEIEYGKHFHVNYSTGMSCDEFLENIQRCECELRADGIKGELRYRTTSNVRKESFEIFGLRLETDFERDDRVSYYRERQQARYESYMEMKLEFEPNGPRTFGEYLASIGTK